MTEHNSTHSHPETEPQDQPISTEGTNSSNSGIEAGNQVNEDRAEIIDGGMSAGFEFNEDLTTMIGEATAEPEVPPVEAMRGAILFSKEAYREPGPGRVMDQPQSSEILLEQENDPQMVSYFITDKRLDSLWTRTDLAKQSVDARVQSTSLARQLFDLLKFSHNELLVGKNRYTEAERHLNEAEFLIDQDQRMRRWSYSYGIGIFVYEFIWTVGITIAFFFLERQQVFGANASDFIYLLGSVVWGCLGGVIGALFALIKHVSTEQDFDRQHTLWYINSPLMGIGLGAVVFIIMRIGLLSLTIGSSPQIGSPLVIYIFAWLCGYQHNVFTDIVKRVLKVFESEVRPPAESNSKTSD